MNKQSNHTIMTDEQLDRVLSLFESGLSSEDIVGKFPQHKEEIGDVLRTIGAVQKEKELVFPPREFFEQIINNVTEQAPSRYSKRGMFSSITGSLIYAFDSIFSHARIAVPAVVMALLLVIFMANRPSDPASTPELSEGATSLSQVASDPSSTEISDTAGVDMKSGIAPQMMAGKALPPATGNADDAVAAFFESFSEEEAIFATGDADIAALIADDGGDAYQNFYEKEL